MPKLVLPSIRLFASGLGSMLQTVINAAVKTGVLKPEQVFAYSRRIGRGDLRTPYTNVLEQDFPSAVQNSTMVAIGVPPKNRETVYTLLAPYVGKQPVIDISAGPNEEQLKYFFPKSEIVCAMPDQAAQVLRGDTRYYAVTALSDETRQLVTALLSAGGSVQPIDSLEEYDRHTALRSSGIGFALNMMKSVRNGYIAQGKSPEEADVEVVRLFSDVVHLVQQRPDVSLGDMVSSVASHASPVPGAAKTTGTTYEELSVLEEANFDLIIERALRAGTHRASEIRHQFGEHPKKKADDVSACNAREAHGFFVADEASSADSRIPGNELHFQK